MPVYPTLAPFPADSLLDEKMLQEAKKTHQEFIDFVSDNAITDTKTGEKTVTLPFDLACKALLLIQNQDIRIEKWMDVVLDLQDYITKSEAWSCEAVKKYCEALKKLKEKNEIDKPTDGV